MGLLGTAVCIFVDPHHGSVNHAEGVARRGHGEVERSQGVDDDQVSGNRECILPTHDFLLPSSRMHEDVRHDANEIVRGHGRR